MRFGLLCGVWLLALLPAPSAGWQQAAGPVVDTIVIVTEDVFSDREAARNFAFRAANAVRFKTRPNVVRRELLFRAGEPFDSALVAETERNLRRLGIFRDVTIDTATIDGRFAVQVHTADGWSTQLQFGFASTGDRSTYLVGLFETNFLGSGNFVSVSYRQDVDRTALSVGGRVNRLFGSRAGGSGVYENLSDGWQSSWRTGWPFRSLSDRRSGEWSGEAADRRVFRFRVNGVNAVDTVRFRRRVVANRFDAAQAIWANPSGYWRVGASARIAREEYILEDDTAAGIPDSVRATVGFYTEWRRANFKVVTHFNGFDRPEDLDLSTALRLSLWLAPEALGYDVNGIGPRVSISSGVALPFGYMRGAVGAGGLFTSGGLDSGQVGIQGTVAAQVIPRHATFLHIRAGALESPAPGREFDLGFGVGPRSFGPHAFVGTRQVWGTFEHRWFVWDNLLGMLGLGFAGFLDYGGAWFPDQPARAGGNVGIGVRTGASRSTGLNVGRIDLGYRFGEGWQGKRWVFSLGRGFFF